MEEKVRIEESTRRAISRYSGDLEKVSKVENVPLEYALKIRQKMQKELSRDVDFQIAGNITRIIVKERKKRLQHYQDLLDSLDKREQLWVCNVCSNEVNTRSDNGIEIYYCPTCKKTVDLKLLDRDKIYERKQSILRDLLAEDDRLMDWLIRMGWTGQTPPTTIIQQKQNVLIVGGSKDSKVLEEIRHLPALEAEKLRQDLKKEILDIDGQIAEAENEHKDS